MVVAIIGIITFIVIIIWGIAHVVNAVMNYQDMQYFNERNKAKQLDDDTQDMVNFANKHVNPGPFNSRSYYPTLK